MKSKATKAQAAQTAYNFTIKTLKQVPGSRSGKPAQPSSSLKNEYATDRKERGRSPTVRALIWEGGLTQVKPISSMTSLKKSSQVQHVEFVVPSSEPILPRPQDH